MSAVYGDYPIGAVLTDGVTIHAGFNRVQTTPSPLAHAECDAIRTLTGELRTKYLKEWTLYTTAEPCAMCLTACYWAGIKEIVYGMDQFDLMDFGREWGNDRFKFRPCPILTSDPGRMIKPVLRGHGIQFRQVSKNKVLRMMTEYVKMETNGGVPIKGRDKLRGRVLRKNGRAPNTGRS